MAPKRKEVEAWNMLAKIGAQLCRYNPGDERPAPTRRFDLGGPMLRLAIEHGKRARIFRSGRRGSSPASLGTVADFARASIFDGAYAYVDFEITDDDASDDLHCLWVLFGDSLRVEFLGPTYGELRRFREVEIERRGIARTVRKGRGTCASLAPRRVAL